MLSLSAFASVATYACPPVFCAISRSSSGFTGNRRRT
jgi:hypothetical protein